jgi:hypothetical protein
MRGAAGIECIQVDQKSDPTLPERGVGVLPTSARNQERRKLHAKVQLRSRRTRGVPAAVIEVRGLVGSDQLNDA